TYHTNRGRRYQVRCKEVLNSVQTSDQGNRTTIRFPDSGSQDPEGSGGRNLENDCGSARRPRRSHFTLKPRTRLPVFLHSSKFPLSYDRMRTFGLSEKSQGSRSTVVCRSYSGSLPT